MHKMTGADVSMAVSGRFVLGRSKGEKISAMEGYTLSERMAATLEDGARRGLSGDDLRALIKAEAVKGRNV